MGKKTPTFPLGDILGGDSGGEVTKRGPQTKGATLAPCLHVREGGSSKKDYLLGSHIPKGKKKEKGNGRPMVRCSPDWHNRPRWLGGGVGQRSSDSLGTFEKKGDGGSSRVYAVDYNKPIRGVRSSRKMKGEKK